MDILNANKSYSLSENWQAAVVLRQNAPNSILNEQLLLTFHSVRPKNLAPGRGMAGEGRDGPN